MVCQCLPYEHRHRTNRPACCGVFSRTHRLDGKRHRLKTTTLDGKSVALELPTKERGFDSINRQQKMNCTHFYLPLKVYAFFHFPSPASRMLRANIGICLENVSTKYQWIDCQISIHFYPLWNQFTLVLPPTHMTLFVSPPTIILLFNLVVIFFFSLQQLIDTFFIQRQWTVTAVPYLSSSFIVLGRLFLCARLCSLGWFKLFCSILDAKIHKLICSADFSMDDEWKFRRCISISHSRYYTWHTYFRFTDLFNPNSPERTILFIHFVLLIFVCLPNSWCKGEKKDGFLSNFVPMVFRFVFLEWSFGFMSTFN